MFYTRKIFQLFQKEWTVVMIFFFEELEHEGSGITYLVGDFFESKEIGTRSVMRIVVSFMFFVIVLYLKSRGSFVDIFCASYDTIMLHIYQNLIYYRDGDLMQVTRML